MVGPLLLALVEAATLAGWLLTTRPRLGPRRPVPVGLAFAAALALVEMTPRIAAWLASVGGPDAALTLGVVPAFTILFWSLGCLARVAADVAGARFRLR